MARTIDVTTAAMIASDEHTRARCVYMQLQDGTRFGFTDHDEDLVIDIVDISDVPVTYRADLGMMPSDIVQSMDMSADSCEIAGPLSDVITRAGIIGRRYNRAIVRIFDVDWTSGYPVPVPLLSGNVADARCSDSKFIMEVRSLTDRLNQTVGQIMSPKCRTDFGSPLCKLTVPSEWTTITAVVDDLTLTVDLAGVHADGFYTFGEIEFITGALAGIRPIEIFGFTGSSATITLLMPTPEPPLVGDQVIVKQGCSKLLKSDEPTIPTCLTWNNVVNFRGEPRMPSSDQYLQFAAPSGN